MKDSRIKPYLFNKKWIPFAEYCDSCFLMLDFDPDTAGKEGQIICYIHDPDKVVYAAPSITELLDGIIEEISWDKLTLWFENSWKENVKC